VARAQGEEALRARPYSGRPAELTPADKRLIPELLSYGAEAYGFRGEVWTCPRVRKGIEGGVGVPYHQSHVARLLKELPWTPQLPLERAAQRDEAALARWRTEIWEELKKRRDWNAES
jgi:transposase